MKRILPLVLCLLLLAGCGAPDPQPTAVPTVTTAPTEPSIREPYGFYLPDSPLEQQTGGALRAYPLDGQICYGLFSTGDDLLVLLADQQAAEEGTGPVYLHRLSGDNLFISATYEITDMAYPSSDNFQVGRSGVTFFNEMTREFVFLDRSLKELRRLALPEEAQGYPRISPDWSAIYYCTEDAIRALDVESGIDRVLKETPEPYKSVDALHMDGRVLQCWLSDDYDHRSLFLSTDTGMTLHDTQNYYYVQTGENSFYCDSTDAGTAVTTHLFGRPGSPAQVLTPVNYQSCVAFLPQTHSALAAFYDEGTGIQTLDHYDLETGLRTASVALPFRTCPWSQCQDSRGNIYMTIYDDVRQCDSIYRWDTGKSRIQDAIHYTGPNFTADQPDYAGLEECQTLAREIGNRHGLNILLWQDALADQPWDYDFVAEYQVPVLRQKLREIDEYLGNYPDAVFSMLADRFGSLNLCLVRELRGSADRGSLDTANGLQFWLDTTPYIAIGTAAPLDYTLYHELFHVMDSQILTLSNAYDSWESLNPQGFRYDYDYVANADRDGEMYLQPGKEAFIDTYSMSFPGEDRARIMEYAMTPGNAERFQSPTMQAKLKKLSQGIRDAFGLRKSPEEFLWEQYLQDSLAYKK